MRRIRSAFGFTLFLAMTLGIYALWFVGAYIVPNKLFWRQLIFKIWSNAFARIGRMRIEIIGTPPKPPFFLVSNHLSYVDIPALRCAADGVFVAKSDLSNWPVAGRIIRDMGSVFIDRANRRDIPRAGEDIVKRLNDGEGVIVFPEGTSTKGETVLPFNSSFLEFAARTDLPVSYCSLTYETPDGELRASDAVCWWDDTTFIDHLFRFFALRGCTAVIRFGDEPVLSANRKELARELHSKVAEHFIPVI